MGTKGLLMVISGPSGAGKGTVVSELIKDASFRLSVSATTRPPRDGERNGVHYHFIGSDEFDKIIAEDGFLEYARYCGNCYGTPRAQTEEWLEKGKNVILEIEVQGYKNIKKKCPDCVGIFIMPPSMEILEKRLRGRGTEDEATIQKRLKRAESELKLAQNYDYIITNDSLEKCVSDVCCVIRAEELRPNRSG